MVNKDFFQALDELEELKKINKEQFIETLEQALTSAYKKMYGEAKSAMVKLNAEKATIKIYSYKTVVEEVEDIDKEISLEEARELKKSYKVGDTVAQEESTKNFGRIAAQTAKQVVMQRLKELEREKAIGDLAEKEDELLTAIVNRTDAENVYVQIPGTHIEGVMQKKDQIPGERYADGDKIKVYVKKIKESFKGTQVQVTRTNPGFLRKLFELEIPEVANGEVIIKNIARDAGNRAKVSVYTEKPHIDPLGACVGNRGERINSITNELNGEKIDLIIYTEDTMEYIARSLSPAKVLSVEINESLNVSRVIVPDDKLSLAIGRAGQNVRLAARLTGWKIDVKSESQVEGGASKAKEVEYELTDLTETEGLVQPVETVEETNFASFEDFGDE